MKVILEKNNGEWSLEVFFEQLESEHDKILAATEALSFVQSHGDLTHIVLDKIAEQYGQEIANHAMSVLVKAVGMSSGEESSEDKTLAEIPVVDGIYIDVK